MTDIEQLLENNKGWSQRSIDANPRFFADLVDQQNPDYLWIGCSDSRVSANVIVDLDPGQIFVHRNVANLVNHTDMNCLSVIQFAVEVLKVSHIIVCGHYGCGGVKAAIDNQRRHLIDNWLWPIQDTAKVHSGLLDTILDQAEKGDRLCELNVAKQVQNISETSIVRDAWNSERPLHIHGWIYGLKDGLIRDLEISTCGENRAYLSPPKLKDPRYLETA